MRDIWFRIATCAVLALGNTSLIHATIQWQEYRMGSQFIGPHRAYMVDLDQDGDNDILVAAGHFSESVSWFENTSTDNGFTFAHHNIITDFNGCCAADAADLDGDGDLDVVGVARYVLGTTFRWAENDGSQNFTVHSITVTDDGGRDICINDLDGDGDKDVIVADDMGSAIYWFENDGEANFTFYTVATGFDWATSVSSLDLDGDGDQDILGAASNINAIKWWENDGSENFTENVIVNNFGGASCAYAIDIDEDGDMDVVGSASEANAFAWFENDGSETFTQHTLGTGFFNPSHVYAGDINHDTFIDVIGPSYEALTWWANDGNETFTAFTLPVTYVEFSTICDIDADGYNDVVAGEGDDGYISWWRNLSNAPNGFTFSQPDSAIAIHSDTLTLSWEATTDPDEDALSYKVQWSEQTNFHEFRADTVLESSVTIDSLQDDTTYYWHVTALDTNGGHTAGQSGTYWSFSVDIYQPPDPFSLISPDAEDTCWTLDTLFTWQRTFDPDPYDTWVHYDVWLDTLADLSTAILVGDSIPDTVFQFLNLLDYKTYYWTVRATDSNTGGTRASDTLHFQTYLPESPGAFSLAFPHDSSRVDEDTVTVRWLSSNEPDPNDLITYHVEWSIDPTFADFNSATTTDTFFTITEIAENLSSLCDRMNWELDELADDQTVYWRVWAVDLFELVTWALPGETGWSFEVYIPQPPNTFGLIAPADEIVMDQLSWQFEWDNTIDPDPGDSIVYELEISTNEFFIDTMVVYYHAGESHHHHVPFLGDDTDYWWRVHAIDTNTNGIYSNETRTFHTAMPERPTPFELLDPADGDTLASEVELAWSMSWDPDPGEDVSFDAVFTLTLDDESDTTLVFPALSDTLYSASLPDSLNLEYWEDYMHVDWFVQAISAGDTVESDQHFEFVLEPNSSVPEAEFTGIPSTYEIAAAYPNPFNSSISIVIALPEQTDLSVEVYNLLGEKVADLHMGTVAAGYRQLVWNAQNMSSGIYFIRAQVPGKLNQLRKVILLQ